MSLTHARPNVIVFFTDQQRWDTCGCYGSPLGLTPNLDAMAAAGTRVQTACTCQPVCGPARASLQTGLYATATGNFRNSAAPLTTDRTIARYFRDAGYRTGYIGKWHLSSGDGRAPVPPEHRVGYDYWLASNVLEFTSHPTEGRMFDGDGRPVEFKQWRTDFMTDRALEFIDAGGGPFFLMISYLEPHFQNDMERFVAPDGYADRYRNAWVPEDLRGVPGDWGLELADYYGLCAKLDENLGTILGRLRSRGLADGTVVAFTSDHGCHFRTRNDEYKRSCHESSIRIPMVFAGPAFDCRAVVPELVSLVDLPPTLLDAAGIMQPRASAREGEIAPAGRRGLAESMHGRSILPLLDRRNDDWPEEVFVQISESEVGRCIRTARWKYSVFAPEKDPVRDAASDRYVERYLYDLTADPHEKVNLAGRRDHRAIADELRGRLIARMVAAGEPAPTIDPARYYA